MNKCLIYTRYHDLIYFVSSYKSTSLRGLDINIIDYVAMHKICMLC